MTQLDGILPVIRGYWDGRYGFLLGSCSEPAECMFLYSVFRYCGMVLSEHFAYRRQIKLSATVNYKWVWTILINSVKSGVSLRKYESEMVL